MYAEMLAVMAADQVPDRPDRFEHVAANAAPNPIP